MLICGDMMPVREITARISATRRETPNVRTLRLDLRGEEFAYRAGQAVAVDPRSIVALAPQVAERERASGRPENPRFYSLASHPLERGYIEITVKEEESSGTPPLVSPWIVRQAREGDTIGFRGPFGVYTFPDQDEPRDAEGALSGVLLLGAGSGVVPNRALFRYALAKDWPVRILVVLQNRTKADVVYAGEWERVARESGGRARVVHVFSRDTGGDAQGHVDRAMLARFMEGWLDPDATVAFVCGPNRARRDPQSGRETPGLIDQFAGNPKSGVRGVFEALGIRRQRIRKEMW
jgi:ferredoxin-NADP reductase